MTEKNTDDDDDGWNDNYDGDDDKVDEIYEKNGQEPPPPSWFGQCPKVNIYGTSFLMYWTSQSLDAA